MSLVDTVSPLVGFPLSPVFFAWAAAALLVDALVGDPVFAGHPIRLLGRGLAATEAVLFRLGARGYLGGVVLFLILAVGSLSVVGCLWWGADTVHPWLGHAVAVGVLWSCFALRDLLAHGERIRRALVAGRLEEARRGLSFLVGRDTERLDAQACGRATVESLAENSVDGVMAPLAYALVFGPLGAVLYKVVSTMDSMVGYKTERYLRFGWCGARLDDLLNYPLARLSHLLLVVLAALVPGCSARKAWRIGQRDHALLPGPNSGWPEATVAGALQRRLVGPIDKQGVRVNERWIGDENDPAGADSADLLRTYALVIGLTLFTFGLAALGSSALHFNSITL